MPLPEDPHAAKEARARSRFMLISLMRLGGIAMILAGIAVVQGALPLPQWAAMLLIVLGMAETFVVPTMLARMWASERR